MILNQRQYNVTKGQISKLEGALAVEREAKNKMDPRVYRAMIAGIESQIEEPRRQLRGYEELPNLAALHLSSAEDLGHILIEARVARGYTQRELANKLKIKPQQIQKYEATSYRSASLKRVIEIMKVLNLDFQTDVPLKSASGTFPPQSSRPLAKKP